MKAFCRPSSINLEGEVANEDLYDHEWSVLRLQ
jgi:hypothetical protein